MAQFKVQSRMNDPRMLMLSVNSDGTLVNTSGNVVTVTKPDTGQYLISINRSFQQTPFVFGVCRKDGVARRFFSVDMPNVTSKQIPVRTFNLSDVATDAAFDILIIGSDARQSVYNAVAHNIQIAMQRPRMLFFRYDGATNTMAARMNPNEGTITKSGTGVYSLTLRQPFFSLARVVACTNSVTRGVEISASSDSFNNKVIGIETFNMSGGAAADTEVFLVVVGSFSRSNNGRTLQELLCPQPMTFINPFEYDGVGDAMLRGNAYFSASKAVDTYTFTGVRTNKTAVQALSCGDGAVYSACNNRANNSFRVDVESATRVYGASIGMRSGGF